MWEQPDWNNLRDILSSEELDSFDKERLEKSALLWKATFIHDAIIYGRMAADGVRSVFIQMMPILIEKIHDSMNREKN